MSTKAFCRVLVLNVFIVLFLIVMLDLNKTLAALPSQEICSVRAVSNLVKVLLSL